MDNERARRGERRAARRIARSVSSWCLHVHGGLPAGAAGLAGAAAAAQYARTARSAAAVAVVVAGILGIHPPGFVAQVVAFAFGLAASSFFPAIVLGIFWKRTNGAGAVLGMIAGLGFTISYIVYFKFLGGTPDQLWFGISPEGIGALGVLVNTVVTVGVTLVTPAPPAAVTEMVESIRAPRREVESHTS